MRRAVLTALLAYLLVVLGLATLHADILVLALPFLLYLLAGAWKTPERIQIQAEHTLSSSRALIGEIVQVSLAVTNLGSSLEEVLLEDLIPEGLEVVEGSTRRVVSLPRGGTLTWAYKLRGRRGSYSLNQLKVTARDILGLMDVRETISTNGHLFVVPPVLRLRRVAIQPRRTRVYSGSIPARQGGPGIEFFDVREYQAGDPPHWINWKQSARHPETVFSNQFEQERVADVGIILDGRRRVNEFGERSIFEHSVLAAASLSDALLNAGNRVGLVSYGRHIVWTYPGYGKLQGERILHDLSRLEPGETQVFSELYVPRRLFPAHSQLILISPLTSADFPDLVNLRVRGYHLLVVSPDPISFELSGLAQNPEDLLSARILRMQRSLLFERLVHAGIQIVDWDVRRPFEQVARQHLERRLVVAREGPV